MPTVLELTREERNKYRKSAQRRQILPESSPAEQRAREKLLERVGQAALLIKQRLKARKVILFGSLAHGAWFMPNSDVDLAVEGLEGAAYWRAWQLLEESIPERSVELIDIETASESLRRAIQRYGVEL